MDYVIGNTYNFEVWPSTILGSSFKNMKLLAELDADTTKFFGFDAAAQHRLVFSTLPEGTPDNYLNYNYLKFKNESGQIVILGKTWVNESTVQIVSGEWTWIKVNAGQNKLTEMRAALTSNGFSVLETRVGANL